MKKINTEYTFKVNTPGLLQEIIVNPQCAILSKPITIFARLLGEVADRASQLNDPVLNDLMCKLALYEIANPYSIEYDGKKIDRIRKRADKLRSVDGLRRIIQAGGRQNPEVESDFDRLVRG